MPRIRSRPSRYAPWLAATSAALVAAQGYYAGHRPLPHYEDVAVRLPSSDPDAIRIVTLGDSTMTGPGLESQMDIWFNQALSGIDGLSYQMTGFAKGGAKTRDVIASQLDAALATAPDLVLVSVGSNDAIRGVPMSVMRSGLETILDAFAESMVVVLGVGDMATIPRLPQPLAGFARARARSAGRMQRSVADRRAHVLYVSMYELAGPTFRSTPGLFLPDLFHPNAVGHRVWADAAAPTIERAVRHLTKPKEPLP